MRLNTILLIPVLVMCSYVLAYPQGDKCAGIITGAKGEVQVKRFNQDEPVKGSWGTQLFAGDQIITGKNSESVITLPDNTVFKLGPGGTLTLSGNGSVPGNEGSKIKMISSASVIDLSEMTSPKEKISEKGALAGMRSIGNSDTIKSGSPDNTLVRSLRPDFSWKGNGSFSSFTIILYNDQAPVWKRKVTSNSVMYPDDEKDLEYGKTYTWNVEGESTGGNLRSGIFKFSIIPGKEREELSRIENEIKYSLQEDDESSSMHSVLGAFYRSRGLIQEAIREFEVVASINPGSSLIHELLGTLYSQTGDVDKSNQEYRKARDISVAQ